MPNYTTNLNLEKPLADEQYNIDVFNANADKIDQFAGQTPARALTADKLTTGAKINGVNFKGDADIVTGAGFYYDTVTYGAGDLAFIYNQDGKLELYKSLSAGNVGHNPLTSTGYWEKDLNDKADTDLSNINASQSAKNEIISWGMPDYSAGISVTYPLSNNPYTAPCNGIFCAWGRPSDAAIRPVINGVKQEYLRLGELSGGSGGYQGRSIYLSKGDVMYFGASYSVLSGCTFYPLKGAK